jgi:phage gp29-like protein
MSKRNNRHKYQGPVAVATIEKPKEKRNSPIKYILDQQKLRTRQDLLKLRLAIDSAENIHSYDRQMLHDIYREIEKDLNLESNWGSRKMKVKEKPFKIVNINSKEENEDLTEMLEAPWFFEWIDACMDSKMWGFSLIEFGPLVNGEFQPYEVAGKLYDAITVIDRDNVKPEFGIITNTPGMSEGLSWADPKYSPYLMFVGNHRSKGLLEKLAKYILFKDNCLGNWSEWAEVFGMDKRVGYTDSDGEDRRNFIKAIRDIGANAYGVFTNRDKIEYLGTQRQDAYKVYHEFVNYVDEQTAKAIFGQDVVTNNTGRVVGTVGENIANMYGSNDARFIKALVNKKLFPLMENLGFTDFSGHKFVWDTTEKLSLKDRSEVDAKISKDMGKEHSDKYINQTYGTEVTKKEEEPVPGADPLKVNKKLRAMYKDAGK